MNETIKELLKRPIAYHPVIAKAFDSVTLAVLWSQLYYWSDKTNDPEGWIYKTREDLFDETGLSRKQQETARKIGCELEVLEEKRIGKLGIMHFRVHIEKACEIIEKYLKKQAGKIEQKLFVEPEKKGKAISNIEYLRAIPDEDIKNLMAKYRVDKRCVLARAEDVIDYCEAKGKRYSNYLAALRNFLKSHIQKHPDCVIPIRTPEPEYMREKPISEEQRQRNIKKFEEMKNGLLKNWGKAPESVKEKENE
jgi:hypothetical protein